MALSSERRKRSPETRPEQYLRPPVSELQTTSSLNLSAVTTDTDPLVVLKKKFKLDQFKEGQQPVIEALLAGHSALAVFPTGGGKSLCYQLPALMFGRGLTLVISPLIALMKDQVDALNAKGIGADMLGSSQNAEEKAGVRRRIHSGETRILYIAPEQLNNEGTRGFLAGRTIAMLAIDEAHCISEWGHAFRPDYLRLQSFAKEIQYSPHRALQHTKILGGLRSGNWARRSRWKGGFLPRVGELERCSGAGELCPLRLTKCQKPSCNARGVFYCESAPTGENLCRRTT